MSKTLTHTRKSMSLPDPLWKDIARFRDAEMITTEAEAVRRLLVLALRAAELPQSARPG